MNALRERLGGNITGGRNGLVFPGEDGKPLPPSAPYGRVARVEGRGDNTFGKRAYGFFAAREVIGRPDLHRHYLRRTAATLGAQRDRARDAASPGHTTPAMALPYQGATAERDRAIADRLQEAVNDMVNARRSGQ